MAPARLRVYLFVANFLLSSWAHAQTIRLEQSDLSLPSVEKDGDWSFAAGVFNSYDCGPFELTGTLRQAVTPTNYGLLSIAQMDYHLWLGEAVQILVGPDLDYADAQYNKTWFGISPGQSVQSGFSDYSPGAGIKDYGVHGSITYLLSDHLLLRGFASLKELTGNDADSPIVERRTQSVIGVGIAFRF